jgi:hypothetical protein
MKYSATWVLKLINHETYCKEDYARFQSQLRAAKKYGLLEMMQRMLKEKYSNT